MLVKGFKNNEFLKQAYVHLCCSSSQNVSCFVCSSGFRTLQFLQSQNSNQKMNCWNKCLCNFVALGIIPVTDFCVAVVSELCSCCLSQNLTISVHCITLRMTLRTFETMPRCEFICLQHLQCHNKSLSDFVFMGSSSILATAGHSLENRNVCIWDTLLPHRSALVQGKFGGVLVAPLRDPYVIVDVQVASSSPPASSQSQWRNAKQDCLLF